MATGMTYTTLKQQLARYIERAFTAASDPNVYEQIPYSINAAERRCARELKILGFQQPMSWTMTAGMAVYAKPAGWRETTSIGIAKGASLDTYSPVFPRSYEYCRTYWPQPTLTGLPKFYADYDFYHWLFAPTPDAAYPAEVLAWMLPALLDDTNQTNWLTNEAPELLLYSTLLELAPFLKNDAMTQLWQSFYDRHMSSTNGEDLQRVIDRSQTRTTS